MARPSLLAPPPHGRPCLYRLARRASTHSRLRMTRRPTCVLLLHPARPPRPVRSRSPARPPRRRAASRGHRQLLPLETPSTALARPTAMSRTTTLTSRDGGRRSARRASPSGVSASETPLHQKTWRAGGLLRQAYLRRPPAAWQPRSSGRVVSSFASSIRDESTRRR